MSINVSEEYREEFEVFISNYQKFCDRIIDLMVKTVPIDELKTYYRHRHPDVMRRLTDTVYSSDIMRGIVDKCSITYITPLWEVMQYCGITDRERMIKRYQHSFIGEGILQSYQHSLDEYLSKLRARYLFGSSKDIVNAETIIFILDWTPDEASFFSIRCLLYEAFHHLDKKIIVQATGRKKNFFYMYYDYDVTIFPFFTCTHTHTHTHTHTAHTCQHFIVAICSITMQEPMKKCSTFNGLLVLFDSKLFLIRIIGQ